MLQTENDYLHLSHFMEFCKGIDLFCLKVKLKKTDINLIKYTNRPGKSWKYFLKIYLRILRYLLKSPRNWYTTREIKVYVDLGIITKALSIPKK